MVLFFPVFVVRKPTTFHWLRPSPTGQIYWEKTRTQPTWVIKHQTKQCTNNSPSIWQNCHIFAAAWSPTTFDSKLQPSHLRRSLWMRSAHMMVAWEPLGLATVVSLGFSHLFGFVKRLYRVSIFVLGLGVGETLTFNETTRWNEGNLWFGLKYIYIYIPGIYTAGGSIPNSNIFSPWGCSTLVPWNPKALRRRSSTFWNKYVLHGRGAALGLVCLPPTLPRSVRGAALRRG